jgi:3',5'-cyclic-AMP phosphodiesterase
MAPLRFHQFTDTHLYASATGAMRGQQTLPSFVSALQQAAGFPGPDAILLTGDLVHDEPGGYAHLQTLLGTSPVPVHLIPGNHDVASALIAMDEEPFDVGGSHLYAQDGNRWLLVMLSTQAQDRVDGELGEAALAALDRTLGAASDIPALLVMHHPPAAVGSAWLDGIGLADAAAFWSVVDRHPQVRGVLWGHVHQAFEGQRGEVRLMGTPSTCLQFLPGSEEFALDSRGPGWRWLELHADGGITSQVEWVP